MPVLKGLCQLRSHNSKHTTPSYLGAREPNELLEGISYMFSHFSKESKFTPLVYSPKANVAGTAPSEQASKKKSTQTERLTLRFVDMWGVLSQSILNKFHPRHTIFLQEMQRFRQRKEVHEYQKRPPKCANLRVKKRSNNSMSRITLRNSPEKLSRVKSSFADFSKPHLRQEEPESPQRKMFKN